MLATASPPETLADLLSQLGHVPLNRIRMFPPPGTATVEDVARLCDREPKRLCELVDGVLVEKDMGFEESRLLYRNSPCLPSCLSVALWKRVRLKVG